MITAFEPGQDRFHDAIQIFEHSFIGKANDLVAGQSQKRGAAGITIEFRRCAVACTIDFDDEPTFPAGEIRKEWPDGQLANEFISTQPSIAQAAPDPFLCRRSFASQGSGATS